VPAARRCRCGSVYPPGFDPKKKYPILQSIHGGPHAASGDTFHYRWNNQVFAGAGLRRRLRQLPRLERLRLQPFLDSITHRWGELELADIEAGTDWLLKKPWADKKRVFATGGSYGGFMVAWYERPHQARAATTPYICHAGCFDWTAMFSDDAYTWHARELGAWYWEDPTKIGSQSPSSFAKAMKTPTLVIHGAKDYRVPDQQGLGLLQHAEGEGRRRAPALVSDENHWILQPRNSKLWYGEFFAWLKQHAGS
jgi:dipeptidyl aminopeptidase/acylaminoacyl peptidase